MSKQSKRYTNQEKAAALAVLKANSGNISRTYRDTGISRRTLKLWSEGQGIDLAEVEKLFPAQCTELADKFEKLAHKSLGLAYETLSEAKPKELTIIAATATDKMNLLRGNPTSIKETRLNKVEQYNRYVDHVMDAAKEKGEQISRDEAMSVLEVSFPDLREVIH